MCLFNDAEVSHVAREFLALVVWRMDSCACRAISSLEGKSVVIFLRLELVREAGFSL